MDMNNMMSMMSGMMGNGGNNNMNPQMMLNMINKMTGKKLNMSDVQSKMDDVLNRSVERITFSIVDILYKEFPSDQLGTLFKESPSKEDKEKIVTKLVISSTPSMIKKLNEDDLDKLFQYLQSKKG